MNQSKLLVTLAITFSVLGTVNAQEADFDLTSQRDETQSILKVPGEKINHHGLVINPTPRSMKVTETGTLDITGGVVLKDKTKSLQGELGFLTLRKKGIPIRVSYTKKGKATTLPDVEGAYTLDIHKNGIRIVGRDSKGVFYAIKTLQQLLESPATEQGKKLPYLSISDYPTFAYRGIVEGFYGTPWSHKIRLSMMNFCGKYKMNTYIYGPKDDPYHNSPNWRLPYPKDESKNIRELVEASKRNKVNFVWAIHPGKDIKWNEEDYQNLFHKFDLMYSLGVRSFAIFFDDIEGEGTNPMKQVELLNRLTREFVEPKGDVTPLIVCPTDYSKLWANPTPQGSLSIYGRALDPSVKVFWTGDVVCSDATHETLDWVNARIKRPALFWWNYAVTDYVRHIVLQGPVYGLDNSLTSNDMCGLLSNPMEHGEASKLSLYSVADYTWNPMAYNAIDSWERGLEVIAPRSKDAYRTFAIHSADTETGYRRDESWETETFRMANYTPQQYDALYREFEKIEQVPADMERENDNPALLQELRPWLEEFGKLGTRGKKALQLMEAFKNADNASFWSAYVQNIMSKEERTAYEAHRSGTMKLQPFYEWAMTDLANAFYHKITNKQPSSELAVGSYPNLKTRLARLMFDKDTTTFYTSTVGQNTGEWIGVDLGEKKPVHEVRILQGRNSVNDVDYFDHAALEYSANGREWKPLIADLQEIYNIHWTGQEVSARYIRLRKLPSEKKNWVAVRSFEVNPLTASQLGLVSSNPRNSQAFLAFDNCPTTSYTHSGLMSFGVKKGTKSYTLLLKLPASGTMTLRMFNNQDKVVAEQTITTDFYQFSVDKNVTKLELDGAAEIFEIIPNNLMD
ncbi:MAG: beta-N-acetylglucosaminidase domain-containing protein [Prevotella sp.]